MDEEYVEDLMEPEIQETSTPVSKSKRKKPKVAAEWSDDAIFKLISCVEVNEQLWNASHPQYRNKIERSSIWKSISEIDFESKFNESELLAKWTNIRIQFRGYAAKAKKTKSGQGASTATKWKFFSAMQFVDTAEENQSSHCESNLSLTESDLGDVESVSTAGTSTRHSNTISTTGSSSSAAELIADSMKDAINMLKERQSDSNDKNAAFTKYILTELRSVPEHEAAYIRNNLSRKLLDCLDDLQKMKTQIVYVDDQSNVK